MVDFFHDHSGMDETTIQTEVDRYIAWPGQALAYKIGQLSYWNCAIGEESSGRQVRSARFHDEVVGSGALPLTC